MDESIACSIITRSPTRAPATVSGSVRRDTMPDDHLASLIQGIFEPLPDADGHKIRREAQGPVPVPCNLFSCGILKIASRGIKDLFNLHSSQHSEAARHRVRADDGLFDCELHSTSTDALRCAKARSLQSEAGVSAVIVRREAMPVRFTPEDNFEEQDPRNQRRQPQRTAPAPSNPFSPASSKVSTRDTREPASTTLGVVRRSINHLLSRVPLPASVCNKPTINPGLALICAGRNKTPATAAEIEAALDAVA
jgi:hypothetical protein